MRSDYMQFGGTAQQNGIDEAATLDYLTEVGFTNSGLARARTSKTVDDRGFTFEKIGANYCDFCFSPLMGGEFDRLADGRERCIRCTHMVVHNREEFVEIFTDTKRQMELAFEIDMNVSMDVHMVNAREIARRTGERFQPTPGFDGRVLGFATKSDAGYELNVENGAPALALVSTTAHELTHIWQYLNWDSDAIKRVYGAENELIIYEGMASWAQIQYLFAIKEFEYAEREEAYVEQRTDEYGIGFLLYRERYPLRRNGVYGAETPFHSKWPL